METSLEAAILKIRKARVKFAGGYIGIQENRLEATTL